MNKKLTFLSGIAVAFAATAYADWSPPANPDPEEIINGARQDFRAGKYADALAKHDWYHHHALEHQSSLRGARLSGVLDSWFQLSKVYPPAFAKLKAVRDDARNLVVDGKGDIRGSFQDFDAINSKLEEENLTVELFKLLDKSAPEKAKSVYDIAERELIGAKEFRLCDKYMNPQESLKHAIEIYQAHLKFADQQATTAQKLGEKERAIEIVQNIAATQIALLVLNDRKTDAEMIAKKAAAECEGLKNNDVIQAALKGNLPERLY